MPTPTHGEPEVTIMISHPDPKQLAKGVRAVKKFIKALEKLTGQEATETRKELKKYE